MGWYRNRTWIALGLAFMIGPPAARHELINIILGLGVLAALAFGLVIIVRAFLFPVVEQAGLKAKRLR